MAYLKITNTGLIEPEDLHVVGYSTKTNDDSSIGQFGSGLKFGTAWALRNNLQMVVFRGTEQIEIGVVATEIRSDTISRMTINGDITSVSIDMGRMANWSAWMVIRELYSNALDGGDATIETVNEIPKGVEDRTTVYLEINENIQLVMDNFSHYFSIKRNPFFENSRAKFYLNVSSKNISIYRKGIRCIDWRRSGYLDINFDSIGINESRLTSETAIDNVLATILYNEDISSGVWYWLLKGDYKDYLLTSPSGAKSKDELLRALRRLAIELDRDGVISQSLVDIVGNPHNKLVLPTQYYQLGVDEDIFDDLLATLMNGEFTFVEEACGIEMNNVVYHIKEWDVNFSMPIKYGKYNKQYTNSDYRLSRDTIFIHSNVGTPHPKEVASNILLILPNIVELLSSKMD